MSDEMPFASKGKLAGFFTNVSRVVRPNNLVSNGGSYQNPPVQGPRQHFMNVYGDSYVNALTTEDKVQSPKSIREGLAGLAAQDQGFVVGPLKRGPDGGIDFYDAQGCPFDVKTAPPGFGGSPELFDALGCGGG